MSPIAQLARRRPVATPLTPDVSDSDIRPGARGLPRGYVVNRPVGMPGAMDDIGNWTEPLGLASIVAEGLTVLAALAGWRSMRSEA